MSCSALNLYAELNSLGLSPRIENGRILTSGQIPPELLAQIQNNKAELMRIFQIIDEHNPGICERCRGYAEKLFIVHSGEVCSRCLDGLLDEHVSASKGVKKV